MAAGGKKFNIPTLDDVYGDSNAVVRSLFKAGKTASTASKQGSATNNSKNTTSSTTSFSGKRDQGTINKNASIAFPATSKPQEKTVSNGVASTSKQNGTANNTANKRTSKEVDLEAPSTSCGPKASRYEAIPSTSKDQGTGDSSGTRLASGTGGTFGQRTGSTFLDVFGLPQGEYSMPENTTTKPKEGPAVPRQSKSNSIVINPRQKGNPVIKNIRNVAWEFGDVIPDYVLGKTSCALFLSLRYHHLHPTYIQDRLQQLGRSYMLRILLVQVDVADPHHSLKELAKMCIMADCTLILAWSPEEAGKYLETYKAYESKPADLIKEKTDKDYLSKATDFLTSIRSVNKTDVSTLVTTFRSIEGIIKASKEDLALCPGFGPQKAKRVYDALHLPFLRSKKPKPDNQS